MKKLFSIVVMAMLALMSIPVLADTPVVGSGIGIDIPVEQFVPYIWMDPDTRIVYHNPADGGAELIQRINNYAFEGEQVCWDVLVMDKNGIEKIADVYVTVGDVGQEPGDNDIEANCDEQVDWDDGDDITPFNPWILEERLTEFDEDTMGVYTCCLTVEPYDMGTGMYGEYWVVGEVEDLDGLQNTFDENERWYFNPQITLTLSDSGLVFGDVLNPVRPGTYSYSDTLTLTNDADDGSGVLLDMTISGTDFYDPVSSGAKCPLSNRLRLNDGNEAGLDLEYVSGQADQYRADVDGVGGAVNDEQVRCRGAEDPLWDWALEDGTGDPFCYYATQGAYSTNRDADRIDIEGYVGIPYETGNERDRAPIISGDVIAETLVWGAGAGQVEYFAGNILSPGADMSITFRLALPEPCNGDFSSGSIYFWGEAI